MALTKVTGQVIKNTTDVTVGVLTVTNTLAVGGTVSIGGTLTYEDVTNIDSVGLITARNGIVVGSGITLSKDGDVFATGVTTTGSLVSSGAVSGTTGTFSGAVSGTTGTFTSTVKSGTTATGIIFSAGDSGNSGDRVIQFKRAATTNDINIQAINSGTGATNLLFNNEGGAASFGGNVSLGDSKYLNIGAGSDLKLSHDTNNSIIANSTGELLIDSSIISLRDTSNNSRLRIEPAGNINIAKNLNVVGITTVNFGASGAALKLERGSSSGEAIDIMTTATSDASRIRFLESGTSKAEVTYSHDNDQIELLGRTGTTAAIITNGDKTGFKQDSNGYITKPLNPVFHAFGGASNVASNTDIVFGQIRFAIGGGYNASDGVYTAPATGYYHFYAQVYRQNTSDDTWWGFFLDTGGGYGQISESRMENDHGGDSGRGYSTLQCSIYWYMTVGHKIKCRVGSTGAVHCNTAFSYFCGNLVG